MIRRLSPAFAWLLQGAMVGGVAAAVAACGNIGLSAAEASLPSTSGVVEHVDAAVDGGPATPAGGANLVPGVEDAGAASSSVGSGLCFFTYGEAGVHICQPDTSKMCEHPAEADAGASTGWDAAPVGEAGDAGAPLSACHVVPQGQTQSCSVAGAGGDGAQCQTGSDCADSFECVGSPGECRHYCCGGNTSCDQAASVTTGGTFCDVQPLAAGGANVPVCEPVTSCTLLLSGTGNGSCPKGETCAVVKDDGTTSCVPAGAVAVGGDCTINHCAADLTCLGPAGSRTCFQLCQVDTPAACPYGTTCTSSAQLFTNANVGICQ